MGDPGRTPLPDSEFDLICAGPVTAAVMGSLRRAQYSRRRLGLRALLEVARRDGAGVAEAERSWTALAAAEHADPTAVEDVLMAPAVGLWLTRALHGVKEATIDVGVLHAVAAAAAVRAGIRGRLAVPVAHGAVTLPTVGQCPTPGATGAVELICGAADEPVRVAGRVRPFRSFRRHRSEAGGLSLDVTVDDLDPHRGFSAPRPPDPLSEADHARWCALLDAAWSLLTDWNTDYATELSAGLTTLVPLDPHDGVVGASSASAFGAVALSAGGSAAEFAETLVHEVQHSKLNAVLELVHLHNDGTVNRHYVPWRDDPRPMTGVLHGLYAFTGVVEFWHGHSPGSFSLALRVRQLRLALEGLDTGPLTEAGRRLLAAVSRRLAVCEPAADAAGHAEVVGRITADHRALWRIRHVEPHPEDVSRLADEWLAGRPRSGQVRGDVVATGEPVESSRATLLKARALNPEGFARAATDGADAAYARDDLAVAAAAYLDRVKRNPGDGAAWVGLGLALRLPALLREPQVVRAVHAEVAARGGAVTDPVRLAAWVDA